MTTVMIIGPIDVTAMKKVVLWMTAVALLAGCAKEKDTNTVVPVGGETYTITATINNPETRTTAERFQDANTGAYKYAFSWEAGEQISVVPTNVNKCLLFSLQNAESGTFTYTTMGGDEQYEGFGVAVTPANALGLSSPSVSSYDICFSGEYGFGHSNAILVAGTPTPGGPNNTQKFQFEHIAALVKVTYKNVPAGTSAMVFEADQNIRGTFHFTSATGISASNDAFTTVDATSPKMAKVEFAEVLAAPLASAEFFLPIPIGEYHTFQVHLVDENNELITGSSASWTNAAGFTLNCADVVACPEVEIGISVVENFSSSSATTNNYDCSSKIDTDGNSDDFDFTWTLEGPGTVFKNGIKLGSRNANGTVTSDDILESIPSGSAFTVKVYAAVWNTDGGELVVSYGGHSYQEAPANDAISITSSGYSADDFTLPTEFVFTKTSGDGDVLTIASSQKRILIDKVEIVNGGTPAPVQSMIVTPSASNPEIVPAEGCTLSYTVTTTNIDSWEAVSDNADFVVVNKTSDGFDVEVAVNETSSPKSATITVSGGSKTEEITLEQAAGEGPSGLVTLFSESFGSVSDNTDISSFNGWSWTGDTHPTGAWKISNNKLTGINVSTNKYEGASGESNLYSGGLGASATISFGNLSSYSNVVLSFGWANNAGAGKTRTLAVEVSGDGGTTWNAITYTNSSNATTNDGFHLCEYSVSSALLGNFAVKFTNNTAGNVSRVDDVLLVGVR